MAPQHYATIQEILEDAGLWHRVSGQTLRGVRDTVNRVFVANNYPLVDRSGDDVFSVDDISVYVDGTKLASSAIESIDQNTGTIVLKVAPAQGVEVAADYYYTTMSLAYVDAKRLQVESIINARMKLVGDCVPYVGDKITSQVRLIAVMYVSALLLIRDYGNHQDIEGTSKDGYKRLGVAKKMLEDFAAAGGVCSADSVASAPTDRLTVESGDLFGEYRQ